MANNKRAVNAPLLPVAVCSIPLTVTSATQLSRAGRGRGLLEVDSIASSAVNKQSVCSGTLDRRDDDLDEITDHLNSIVPFRRGGGGD